MKFLFSPTCHNWTWKSVSFFVDGGLITFYFWRFKRRFYSYLTQKHYSTLRALLGEVEEQSRAYFQSSFG